MFVVILSASQINRDFSPHTPSSTEILMEKRDLPSGADRHLTVVLFNDLHILNN
jgi:hypothetical protein